MQPIDWIVFVVLVLVSLFGAPLLCYLKERGVL